MALPRQVRQAEEEVKRIEEMLARGQQDPPPDPKSQEPVAGEDGRAGDPAGDQANDQPTNVSEVPDGQPQPEATPGSEQGEQDAPRADQDESQPSPQDTAQDESKWEHKYKRLQGKYNAEVPRLHDEVKELRALVQQLQQQQAQPPAQPEPEPEQPSHLVTDEDVDAFGEDLIDLQRRVAREVAAEFSQKLSALERENQQLKEQFGTVRTTSFEAKLLQQVPDFYELDQDPAWIEWLNEWDPMLRAPRRNVAGAAYQAGDVEAVKHYVDLFRQQQSPALAAPQPTPAVKPERKQELERQVQPTRANKRPQPGQKAGRIYTASEAEQAFNNIRVLISKGKRDEAVALEQEISAAYAEGRVR